VYSLLGSCSFDATNPGTYNATAAARDHKSGISIAVSKGMRAVFSGIAFLGILVSGCTTTLISHLGPLPDHRSLVTLVVTEDRSLIKKECMHGEQVPVLGCQLTLVSILGEAPNVRAVKIVRYTDKLPSRTAVENEAHQVCHIVTRLQGLPDLCHAGNGEMAEAQR
jgi:hypothetical protein